MGHDGFIVHIHGNNGIYYAPTNSYSWFITKQHHHKRNNRSSYYHYPKHLTKRQREDLRGRDELLRDNAEAPKYMRSHFRRTNNKRLLRKNGYKIDDFGGSKMIESKYYPNNKHAYIPKSLNLKNILGWQNYNVAVAYNYQGHNIWEKY